MSSLPNSKSSFLRAAQGCGALALASAMVLPMTPALAQNAAPTADAAVAAAAPQVAHQDAADTPTLDVSIPDGYKYDGVNPFLITTEGGTVHVKGTGYTKEWRAQHGTVALYIAPAKYAPSGYEIPTSKMLRFVEGQDFTISDDGTFEADLKVEAYKLAAYYFVDDDNFHDPTGGTKYDVRYEIHVVAEQKGQKPLTAQELWTSKVLATSDIIEFDHPTQASAYRDGNLNGTVNLPANTLNASKKYVIEVWANDGYSETGELLAPVVGKSTEGRGTLLAWQDLDLNGTNGYKDANLPNAQDPKKDDNQKPDPSDEKLKTPATRGELAAALYIQAGTPEVKLPETSPWPDVKTDDPNFPAYVWARQKGITFGWSDGKFHADAGISNATVAAFAYRAAGSPAVTGNSPYSDVAPGSAFYREILWAQQNKVVLNASGAFDAQHMVTHGELETLIEAFQARAK